MKKICLQKQEKINAIGNAIKQIERDFGKGSIMKLGEAAVKMHVEVISSGSLSIDVALGIGGIPQGRIIEIFGPESSGKTTVALHAIAEVQRNGDFAAFIDAEHALDPIYAKNLGVDINNLLVSQPDNGEQALDIVDALVRSGVINIIVIDSVAALAPKAEIEGDMGDTYIGLHAKLMSQALRKLTGIISKSKTIVIFINQIRENVITMSGSPEITTGGRALKFYASVRMDVRKIDNIKQGNDMIGNRTRIKVVKNKIAPPFKHEDFDLIYGLGISKEGSIIDIGTKLKIIKKNDDWYSYEEFRLGHGRENVRIFLKKNPIIAVKIEKKIRSILFIEKEII